MESVKNRAFTLIYSDFFLLGLLRIKWKLQALSTLFTSFVEVFPLVWLAPHRNNIATCYIVQRDAIRDCKMNGRIWINTPATRKILHHFIHAIRANREREKKMRKKATNKNGISHDKFNWVNDINRKSVPFWHWTKNPLPALNAIALSGLNSTEILGKIRCDAHNHVLAMAHSSIIIICLNGVFIMSAVYVAVSFYCGSWFFSFSFIILYLA